MGDGGTSGTWDGACGTSKAEGPSLGAAVIGESNRLSPLDSPVGIASAVAGEDRGPFLTDFFEILEEGVLPPFVEDLVLSLLEVSIKEK